MGKQSKKNGAVTKWFKAYLERKSVIKKNREENRPTVAAK